ncbi:DUF2304 domain-containing protein [Intrasporangium sp. DVR]|uniref:DUF2304 domain-containing protein n=1 Tax=Intrasporangium sp. DVR TaxID=3127867 RepID=UPI00313A669F
MSRQSVIQILLIAATLALAWRLLAGTGQRTQAVRRLGLLVLAGLAIYSIIDPSKTWTGLAKFLGVGRGADLILYGLVVAFLGFVVTTFKRFRDMEIRYTRLARRIALDEAVAVHEAFPSDPLGTSGPSSAPTPKGTDAD